MTSKDNPVCFISLDVGTTSVKTALFSSTGELLALLAEEYDLYTPSENIVELNPEKYWECCKNGIKNVLLKSKVSAKQVKSIGISSQAETLIMLDKHGEPVYNAIVWLDNRSDKEAEEIKKEFGCDMRTGQTDVLPTWPLTKILWMKKNKPDIFSRIHRYLLVEDYIIYKLTGQFKGEYSLYSSSYMLDIINKQWWREILDYAGIDADQLAELDESGEIVGNLSSAASKELGLEQETQVITGALDQVAAVIGSGNVKVGIVTESTGAVLAVCCTLEKFPEERLSSTAAHYHAVPDKYLTIGWCPTGGLALKWLKNTFFTSDANEISYEVLSQMAETIPAGSQGLLFFPYMAGPGTLEINPETRGAFMRLELHHKKEHFVRAVMESAAFVLEKNIRDIKNFGGSCVEIRSLGGASKSNVWNQMKADVTGKRIITMECPEAASLGIAVLQAKALNVYPDIEKCVENMVRPSSVIHPVKENQNIYESVFKDYLTIEKQCFCKK